MNERVRGELCALENKLSCRHIQAGRYTQMARDEFDGIKNLLHKC